MPIFGAEMLVLDRRLVNRLACFRPWLNTPTGAITFLAIIALIAYACSILIAHSAAASEFFPEFIRIIGFVVVPLYASFNALSVGTLLLSDAVDRKIAHEWIAAGIPGDAIATQLFTARAVRYILPAAVYTAMFITTFVIFSEDAPFYGSLGIGSFAAIALGFILFQATFISAAAFFSLLARSASGRFLLVFGYYITHTVLPIVLVILAMNYIFRDLYDETAGLIAMMIHPYGALIMSFIMLEGGIGDNPLQWYFICVACQLLMIYLFFRGAVVLFRKKAIS